VIVLDTNVISELMRPHSNPNVVGWLARQPRRDLFTTTVMMAEIGYGVALLPDGRRKSALLAGAQRLFENVLAGRILSFDIRAAALYGEILSHRRRMGRSMPVLDAQIAAIALAARAEIATRNVGDFDGCGVTLVNPWAVG
jgi:toxin FitB